MKVIELNRGQVAIVDDEDFELLAQYRWHLHTTGYAARSVTGMRPNGKRGTNTVKMHRLLIGECPKGLFCDHINGNRLDNRRSNLRIVTREQNNQNRGLNVNNKSGLKGVAFMKDGRRLPYYASISVHKKRVNLGAFSTKEEAHAAYCAAAAKHFGEFARFN